MTIKSPCIGVCSTTLGDDTCRGCGRTLEQIRDWGAYTDTQRSRIMTNLDWAKECNYISDMCQVFLGHRSPDKRCDPDDYRRDPEVFLTYCRSQQKSAHDAGRHDAVTYIEHVIDDMKIAPTQL